MCHVFVLKFQHNVFLYRVEALYIFFELSLGVPSSVSVMYFEYGRLFVVIFLQSLRVLYFIFAAVGTLRVFVSCPVAIFCFVRTDLGVTSQRVWV